MLWRTREYELWYNSQNYLSLSLRQEHTYRLLSTISLLTWLFTYLILTLPFDFPFVKTVNFSLYFLYFGSDSPTLDPSEEIPSLWIDSRLSILYGPLSLLFYWSPVSLRCNFPGHRRSCPTYTEWFSYGLIDLKSHPPSRTTLTSTSSSVHSIICVETSDRISKICFGPCNNQWKYFRSFVRMFTGSGCLFGSRGPSEISLGQTPLLNRIVTGPFRLILSTPGLNITNRVPGWSLFPFNKQVRWVVNVRRHRYPYRSFAKRFSSR